MKVQEKYTALQEYLQNLQKVAVAFSSGVDSTLLLKVAADTLGTENVLAVTACSPSFPKREKDESAAFCDTHGIRQVFFDEDELSIPGFAENAPDRCYHCKHGLFETIQKIAHENGIEHVCEGSNMDDNGDYRPGLLAIAELGVKSPFRHVGLTKEEIRTLSRQMGLPTWSKPAFACLASRVPYGERITEPRLKRIEKAEQKLVDLGFTNIRVRDHGNGVLARIELTGDERQRIMEPAIAEDVDAAFKALGYQFVAVELTGYRTGSLNRQLSTEERTKEQTTQDRLARGVDYTEESKPIGSGGEGIC